MSAGTHYAFPPVSIDASASCHHVLVSLSAAMAGVVVADQPVFAVHYTLADGATQDVGFVMNSADGYARGSSHTATHSPIVAVELRVYGGSSGFTLPSGSSVYFGVSGNSATIQTTAITGPAAVTSAVFSGAPSAPDAVCLDPNTLNRIWFFKGDYYNVYSLDDFSFVSGPHDIATQFVGLTLPLTSAFRTSGPDGTTGLFAQIILYDSAGYRTRYTSSNWTTNLNDGWWHGNESWRDYDAEALSETDGRIFLKDNQFWTQATNAWNPYGASTSYYQTLPHDIQAAAVDRRTDTTMVFKDGIMYILDTTNHTVTSTTAYG